jgi:phosphate transport system substrate-binding protein
MMVYKNYPAGKGNAMKKFVQWALTDGQKLNTSLDYTRIPAATAQKVINEVNSTVK